MVKTIEEPCYHEIAMAGIDRLVNGHKPKKGGLELIMDNEIGPDVRYVLSSNDIRLVKRYLMGPITPAEYRELNHKLTELKGRELKPDESFVQTQFDSKIESHNTSSSVNESKEGDSDAAKPDPGISIFA